MMPLPIAALPKLRKLIPVLSSDKAGEVVATAGAISRTLKAAGADWHALAAQLTEPRVEREPPPPPHGDADLLRRVDVLRGCGWITAWESEFLASVGDQLRWRGQLSVRQRAVIDRLWAKYTARGM